MFKCSRDVRATCLDFKNRQGQLYKSFVLVSSQSCGSQIAMYIHGHLTRLAMMEETNATSSYHHKVVEFHSKFDDSLSIRIVTMSFSYTLLRQEWMMEYAVGVLHGLEWEDESVTPSYIKDCSLEA